MATILHLSVPFSIHRSLVSSKSMTCRFAEENQKSSVFFEEPQEEVTTPAPTRVTTPTPPQFPKEVVSQRTSQPPPQRTSQPPPQRTSQLPQQRTSQPPPQGQRLDPLIAALTRNDLKASPGETKNVPFFGEVQDGEMKQLAAAGFVTLAGLILSLVVAYQSRDIFSNALAMMSNQMGDAAFAQTNNVYDEGCRGLCSSQEESLEGLRTFMETITSNTRKR